jgi:hypothetical protein
VVVRFCSLAEEEEEGGRGIRGVWEKTYVSSSPVTLGKQRIGTMRRTKAQAIAPTGREKRPRCQGPGRKRSATKKTRMKMGIVKALGGR